MNWRKYRKWYLSENWGENQFSKITYYVEPKVLRLRKNNGFMTVGKEECFNHPLVLTGNAFWINSDTLCVGYKLNRNPHVFRPIFSHKRQKLIDKLILDIKNPSKFWKKLKSRYFLSLVKIKKLPVVCIDNIVLFVY
jgi:hypothetical protein